MTTQRAAAPQGRGQWVAHGHSVPGRGKSVNEDHLWLPDQMTGATVAQKGRLYIVSDGVGGYKGGEIASALVVRALSQEYYADPDPDPAASLQRALAAANVKVYQETQRSEYKDMAATVVAAVVHSGHLVVANVGDSRAYRLRGEVLEQLSVDHTWVAERVAAGVLTAEEAAHHQLRHVITRSMGRDATVEPSVRTVAFEPGDVLLLACDGLWEPLEEDRMATLLKRGTASQSARALVEAAVVASGTDDTTAVVVKSTMTEGGLATLLMTSRINPLWALFGIAAVLLLVILFIGLRHGPIATAVESSVTPMSTQVTDVPRPSVAATRQPVTEDVSSQETAIPTPLSALVPESHPPTSTPVMTNLSEYSYCIAPVDHLPTEPAYDINPNACGKSTGRFIDLNANVLIENRQLTVCNGVEVTYDNEKYLIYAWRLGKRNGAGTCEKLADWRTEFPLP